MDTKFVFYDLRDMKNVTVSMDEDVARWARVHAAKQGQSVSRMIGELVERMMRETEAYDATMQQFLSRTRGGLGGRAGYPTREAVHDRGSATWGRPR